MTSPTPRDVREAFAETRVRRARAEIVRHQLRAMNPDRSSAERAEINAGANRLAARLRLAGD